MCKKENYTVLKCTNSLTITIKKRKCYKLNRKNSPKFIEHNKNFKKVKKYVATSFGCFMYFFVFLVKY